MNKVIFRQWINWVIGLSILILLIINYTRTYTIDEKVLDSFTSFNRYDEISEKPLIYEVELEGGMLGYLAFGTTYGYQSDIRVGTVIDATGRIVETLVYEQNETPAFIEKIYKNKFQEFQFHGSMIADGFERNTQVIPVSGATISSVAITEAIKEASQAVGNHQLDIKVPESDRFHLKQVDYVLLGMFLLTIIAYITKNKKLRYLTMVYSIVLLGFKYKQFIAYSWFVSLLIGKVPSIVDNAAWYILLGGTITFVMVTGKNIYCTYICPFGVLQEFEFQLAKLPPLRISGKIMKYLKPLPTVLAYVAFVTALISEQIEAVSYEPFTLVFGFVGTDIQWVLLPLVLVISLFMMRFYCRIGCPVGLILNILLHFRKKVVAWIHQLKEA